MSHKYYYNVSPCQNRILQKKWDQHCYEMHQRKLKEAKHQIDDSPPKTYIHVHLRLKKLQIDEERLAVIERDNRLLLEKMSRIMRTGGSVDNHNDYSPESLSIERRQRELLRVTMENQEILQRIRDAKPIIDNEKLAMDWAKNEQFMEDIARYPSDWWEIEENEREEKKKKKESEKEESNEEKKDNEKPEQTKA